MCLLLAQPAAQSSAVQFEIVQSALFSTPGGQPNAWADYDGDGDLDLFVGFRGAPNRLYRNERGGFVDVAASAGLADTTETRAAAWGDYDSDGDPDLYVGFANAPQQPNKVYRNDSGRFTDAAPGLGIELRGASRQAAWVDYDGDGDLDLFAAFRDVPNRLFRNDGATFTDVSKSTHVDDTRKTVGGVWWDADTDGDLDLFVANQEGDANGYFRNDGGVFSDAARDVGVDMARRPRDEGGVGPTLADIDRDGDFDLFVANYGRHNLFRNEKGRFTDIASASGLVTAGHVTTAAFGDVDADGWPDLYLGAFLASEPNYRDYLFRNRGVTQGAGWTFADVLPDLLLTHDATHGVQWADFDANGTLDLALTNNDAKGGGHALLRNLTPPVGRLLAVEVVDGRGRMTRAGAEVRVYGAGTRTLLSSGIVDSGSGYCSQNAMPVFVAAPKQGRVDVEVTSIERGARRVTRSAGVDPNSLKARRLVIRTGNARETP
jgi:FG-GAP-like repeat